MMGFRNRKGDTLIEVLFAIAILSFLTISVISTMTNGTLTLQGTLESTMTRNEIDAQAEVLRYIQSSYIAEREDATAGNVYSSLWNDLKSHAVSSSDAITNQLVGLDSCATLYNSASSKSIFKNKAFMIDTKNMKIYSSNENASLFKEASLYPRVVYGSGDDNLESANSNTLVAFEGIYIIAVKDGEQTTVVNSEGETKGSVAYYDFYVRSCWNSVANASSPDTVSTVVRLYDPDIETANYESTTYIIDYNVNGGQWKDLYGNNVAAPTRQIAESQDKSYTFTIPNVKGYVSDGRMFLGYQINNCTYDGTNGSVLYLPGDDITLKKSNPQITLCAVYSRMYNLNVYASGGRGKVTVASKYANRYYASSALTAANVSVSLPVSEKVTTTATPNSKYVFSDWYNGDAFEYHGNPYTFDMPSGNKQLTAKFSLDVTSISKIRVLNVYPVSGANLKTWMESNGYGKNIIKVDTVSITLFNRYPTRYNANNYDVIVLGFWDCNSSIDLSAAAYNWINNNWTSKGKPLILGHDTLAYTTSCSTHTYFNKLAPYVGLNVSKYKDWGPTGNSDNRVKIVKDSTFTKYPWNIGNAGDILTIPTSHDLAQVVVDTNNIFLKFVAQSAASTTADNFYLVVNNTGAMIQTGHMNGQATTDEQKILANLIFYIYSQYSE